jgi:DNA (cytosine-5)-methyltransferase 1
VLTFGSLFSGIGGMDLGLERAGLRCLWQSEIDAYAVEHVLSRHWPNVRQLGDATKIDYADVEKPDVLAGGFMCTDLSVAGKQAGMGESTRSGITWRELVRAIRELRPRYVLVENVPALLSGERGGWFGKVLGELATLGYDAEWDCIPAKAFGAPHERDRVFIVAYPHKHSHSYVFSARNAVSKTETYRWWAGRIK